MNSTSAAAESSAIEIASGSVASVRVRIGATISVVRGRVWLTQEGDRRDYCVCAGVTFCADRDGLAVLSALDEPSVALVRHSAGRAASMKPGTLRIDSMEQIAHAARRARNAAVSRALASLFSRLASALRRLAVPRRKIVGPAVALPRKRTFRGAVQSLRSRSGYAN